MNYKALLAVGIALVALQLAAAHPVKRSCACALKGTDVCGCNSVIVRPSKPAPRPTPSGQRVVCHRIPGAQDFKPLGSDLCTCGGMSVVQPAHVPRIPCTCGAAAAQQAAAAANAAAAAANSGAYSLSGPVAVAEDSVFNAPAYVSYQQGPVATLPGAEDFTVDLEQECNSNRPQGPFPADAVSLALAYEMAQRANKKIKEENLMFGPIQKPIDGAIKQVKKFIPEDALYAVKNQIVELRAPSRGYGLTAEEEAEASLIAAQEAAQEVDSDVPSRFLSYNDLGFAPVQGGCGSTFVRGQYVAPSPPASETFEYAVPADAPAGAGPGCVGGAYGGGIVTIPGTGNNEYEASSSSEDNSYEQETPSCGCGRY